MTEFEKMRHGEFYDYTNDKGNASNVRARQLCARLQTMTLEDKDYRKVMEELIPDIPASTIVNPPFHCDHGHGIRLGENVFINYNATMLDGGMITIGDNCQIGPNCQLVDFAAIDFETANCESSSVCSVGIVVVRGGEVVDTFYSLIQPEPNYYNYFCQRVHGLSQGLLLSATLLWR